MQNIDPNTMNKEYQVMLLGTSGVGKSCLANRFVNDEFISEHKPTKMEIFSKDLPFDVNQPGMSKDKPVSITILDISGKKDHLDPMAQHIKPGAGFMLLFDLSDYSTLPYLAHYRDLIYGLCPKKKFERISIVMVGTKSDRTRAIPENVAWQMARTWKVPYVETSAKTNKNILDCFEAMIKEIDENNTNKSDSTGSTGVQRKIKKKCTIV